MMCNASCSNLPNATPECTTVEFIDDNLVSYPTHELAQRGDLLSEQLRTSERDIRVNVKSFERPAGNPDRPQFRPTQTGKIQKTEEKISMNARLMTLPINSLCRPLLMIIGLVLFGIMSVSPVAAQVETVLADFIDWDLPSLEGAGTCPSAIGAVTLPPTGDPVYYVTLGICPSLSPNNMGRSGPVMVRFTPGTPMASAQATWSAWNLGPTVEDTGGMKITRAQDTGFVRGSNQIIRVNMNTGLLTHWTDVLITTDPISRSDLALVERGGAIDLYSTHNDGANGGIVERLTVPNGSTTATVTRWAVGGGAGDEYLGGVAYFQGKIYFSESIASNIGILDPNTNTVRRFSLLAVGAATPRQISIDTSGIVWVVTGSGHLVSLNPCTGDMASYMIPGLGLTASPGPDAAPFGITNSGGVVGFTEMGGKKVGMLIPNKPPVQASATPSSAPPTSATLFGTTECIRPDTGVVQPQNKPNNPAIHSDIDPMGEFIEASLPDTGDTPIGIYRDPGGPVGSFYFVQGPFGGAPNLHRLSHVVFPVPSVVSAGLVTGGGTLRPLTPPPGLASGSDDDDWDSDSDGGVTANFGFNVYRKTVTSPIRGHLNYVNKTTNEHVKSVTIDTMSISGTTATFSGTCTNNGVACSFTVTVQDNGNPGKGRDTFNISGGPLAPTPNGGTLSGGNIKIRQPK
jgi:hypothetical protein